jgi:hypothetical protein
LFLSGGQMEELVVEGFDVEMHKLEVMYVRKN